MALRKTGRAPIALQGGNRGGGALFSDPAGHPYALPMTEAVTALGAGDVHGPTSSTDGDLAVFDGTSGKHVKDSGIKSADVPSDDQKAALAGTSGTPSVTNKYVTDSDARLVSGGSGITQLTGDVTAGPGTGSQVAAIGALKVTTAMLQAAAVTYAKMQNVSASAKLLGSSATGSGAPPSEITLGTNLSMSGSTLNATGGGGTGNVSSTGAEGSEPGSPASGDLYLPNNGVWQERYSGSAWVPWGPIFPLTDPALKVFTWVNQGTASIDTTNGGVFVDDATAGSLNLRVRSKAVPATPYTLTTFWIPLLVKDASFSGVAVGWRDSVSGKLIVLSLRNNTGVMNLVVDKYTNPTTFSASYTSQDLIALTTGIFLRLADDGTNRTCSWSTDGQHFRTLHTIGRTDFLTADSLWFGLYINTSRASGTLLSWKEA